MKFRILYMLLAGMFIAGISLNFQRGPATDKGQDFTASPLSQGGAFCSMCHFQGAFSPTMDIALLSSGDPVMQYTPGETYQLQITITATGSPTGYGFQAVALDGNNASQGSFGNLPADVQTADLGGVQYVEHGRRLAGNTLLVDWTAPAGGGDVTFYAAGIAADGSNETSGDGAANASLTLQATSSTDNIDNIRFETALLSNPVNEVLPLRINSPKATTLKANILDLNGRVAMSQDLRIMSGEQVVTMEAGELNRGIYFLQLSDGESVTTEKIMKL